jgi:ATP-dependent helicase/nuclease subunit A
VAWAQGYKSHTTARDLPGYARLVSAPAADEDQDQDEQTLQYAAEEVKRLAAEAPGRSIGVLTRSNRAVGALISALAKLGVPASEEGGNLLSQSAAVSALLSLFTMADHPGDKTARFHVARSPLGAIVGLTQFDSELLAADVARQIRLKLMNEGYGPTTLRWVEQLASHCDERDLNRLLKLVELAYRYEDLASLRVRDFVSHVESQKVEDPAVAQVRVMTIHKSKGLEFDVVVLPDLLSNFTGQPPMVITGQPQPIEPIKLVCRYPKKDLRAFLPDDFQKACEQCDERAVRESLCVLYVALTRGIHALHMIIPPSSDREKNVPSTYAGMLRVALTNGSFVAPGKVLYEHGDKRWFEKMAAQPTTRTPEIAHKDLKPVELHLKTTGDRRTRALGQRTPSAAQGGAVVRLSERLRLGDSTALSRGSLFHAWFELIEWLDEGAPSDAALHAAAKKSQVPGLSIDGLIKEFRRILTKPEIRGVLSRNPLKGTAASLLDFTDTLEVWRERAFAVRDGDSLLSGAFDRVVVSFQDGTAVQAEIIDFKTDTVSSEAHSMDNLVEHYRPQMNSYRRAVAALTGLPKKDISARLLFVGAGRTRVVAQD